MDRIFAKTSRALLLALICLLAVFYVFNVDRASAAVEFTADVELDLTGLDNDVFIAAGSAADSLELSSNTLSVDGIAAGGNPFSFRLKRADDRTVSEITPSSGTVDFTFDSAYETNGNVSQFDVVASDPLAENNFEVKVATPSIDYGVKLNGETISGSPFESTSNSELIFANAGSGTYTIDTLPLLETLSAISIATNEATLRGDLISIGGGNSADVWFEWGTTSGNYTYNNSDLPETKTSTGVFSKTISIDPETETRYYFRAVAENDWGVSYGAEESFVNQDRIYITVTIGGETRTIEVDREGKIIIERD